MSISCGASAKAEKHGLEPRSQISRTPARPPARLLNACVMVANPARLAERRQNYLSASGLVAGCSANSDARRASLAAILSTGLLSLKRSGQYPAGSRGLPGRSTAKRPARLTLRRRGLPECRSTTGLPVPRLPSWPSRKLHGKGACQIYPGRRGLPECRSTIGLPVPRLASWPSRELQGKGACQIDPGRRGLPECRSTIGLPGPRSPTGPSSSVSGNGACQCSSLSPWPSRKFMDNGAAGAYNVAEGARVVSVGAYNQ